MPQIALTDQAIKNFKPTSMQVDYADQKLMGFGVRVARSGTKSFYVKYRVNDRQKRYTIGRYPVIRLREARERARDILARASKGEDPSAEKKLSRASQTAFDAYVALFIELYAKPKNSSWKETERILKQRFVLKWRRRDLSSITRQDIVIILDQIKMEGHTRAANSAFAAIRRLMNWAVERGDLDTSPCAGLKTPSPLTNRNRVLSDAETAKVWNALTEFGYPFGPLAQLLFLTAQRRCEVAKMRWRDLDFEERTWTFDENKASRPHTVPLSPLAVSVLQKIPKTTSEYVFPAHGNKQRPVSGFSKWKRKLDQLSGVDNWRIHDIRRTATTGMAKLKFDPHVVDRILNHSTGTLSSVARIYNQHSYLDEGREALDAWAKHILKITSTAQAPAIQPTRDMLSV